MKILFFTAAILAAAPSFAQSDDCAGIVPDVTGDFVAARIAPGSGEICVEASADQAGNVAFSSRHPTFRIRSTWTTFDSSGNRLGNFVTEQYDLVPQPRGFEAVWRDPRAFGGAYANRYDADGTVLNSVNRGGDMCDAEIFRSSETGAVGVSACYARPAPALIDVYDPGGNLTASFAAGQNDTKRVVVGDEYGMNLVTFWPGTGFGYGSDDFVGQWFDDTGAAVSDPFYIATGASGSARKMTLRALIGGGAVLQVNDQWIASFPSGVAEVDPPPQFLADHPGWDFYIVRGRQGYALVSRNGSFGNHLPLYSAAGNRCGALDFPGVTSLSVGADGTVLGAGGADGCSKRWWPALLSAP